VAGDSVLTPQLLPVDDGPLLETPSRLTNKRVEEGTGSSDLLSFIISPRQGACRYSRENGRGFQIVLEIAFIQCQLLCEEGRQRICVAAVAMATLGRYSSFPPGSHRCHKRYLIYRYLLRLNQD
jgi:hypothetical protein